jgi:hypothetical protein
LDPPGLSVRLDLLGQPGRRDPSDLPVPPDQSDRLAPPVQPDPPDWLEPLALQERLGPPVRSDPLAPSDLWGLSALWDQLDQLDLSVLPEQLELQVPLGPRVQPDPPARREPRD